MRKILLTVTICLIAVAAAAQTTRYVRPSATGDGTGRSWGNASNDLQAMINASSSGDRVFVAAGTYVPIRPANNTGTINQNNANNAFVLKAGVAVYGGFDPDNGSSIISNRRALPGSGSVSILSGDMDGDDSGNSSHVVIIAGGADYTLDGFVIQRGNASSAPDNNITVNGQTVARNRGGGIYITNATGTVFIQNCWIRGNRGNMGAGVYTDVSPLFTNCIFSGNYTTTNSGSNSRGAGLYNAGTGLFGTLLINCTFSGNRAGASGNGRGGAIYNTGGISVANTIIYGNSAADGQNGIRNDGGSVNTYYCLVGDGSQTTNNFNSVSGNPQFVNAPGAGDPFITGDYKLNSNSTALNAGDNSWAVNVGSLDIQGLNRLNGTVDLGAHERGAGYPAMVNTIHYVKPDGTGDGSSWAGASGDLQEMINYSISGDQVFVAGGTYKPNRRADATSIITPNDRHNAFVLKDGVKIYGNFAGTESALSQRNLSVTNNKSILTGDFNDNDAVSGSGSTLAISNNSENAYRVVIASNVGSGTILDGFTLSGGNTSGSSEITVNGQTVTADRGGGLQITYSSPVVSNCVFTGNNATLGGGVCVYYGSSPSISNSIFHKNTGAAGGGMDNAGSPTVTNCTFWGNRDISGGSSGIRNETGTLTLQNSIIYGNNSGIGIDGGSVTATYSLVQGSGSTSNGNINGSTDPLFENAPEGDFRLHAFSPVINKGSNSLIPAGITTDIAGNSRTQLGTVDMGAYEAASCTVTGETINPVICAGSSYEFGGTVYTESVSGVQHTFPPSGDQVCSRVVTMNLTVVPLQRKFYVKPGGTGDGSSWAGASGDLQAMINEASSCGDDIIFVAAGTYTPNRPADNLTTIDPGNRTNSFVLKENVKIYGGFAGWETSLSERAPDPANPSILSGDFNGDDIITGYADALTFANNGENAYHVVIAASADFNNPVTSATVLDGFTIKGGNANGSGIQPTVNGHLTKVNTGGGLYRGTYASPSVTNCVFTANYGVEGGAITTDGGQLENLVVTNCVFSGNYSNNRGSAAYGGAIEIVNSTIWGNRASTGTLGGVLYASGGIRVHNSIIYQNTNSASIIERADAVTYSLVQGSSSTANGNINGSADPMFLDAENGDFRLHPCSPVVNKGSNALVQAGITTDLAGDTRIQHGVVDMGAYETSATGSEATLGDFTFTTQQQLNNFWAMYSGLSCDIVLNNVVIGHATGSSTSNITDLSPLQKVTAITGHLTVRNNPNLTSLIGLGALQSVEGNFSIHSNAALANLTGLNSLANIGGDFHLSGNASLAGMEGIGSLTTIEGGINMEANTALVDISVFENINTAAITGSTGLRIVNNPLLAVCNLPNFCTYLQGSGNRTISGNADDCVNEAAVINACSVPCSATYTGDLVFNTQTQLNDFTSKLIHCSGAEIEVIEGNVVIGYESGITDSDITDLSPLQRITAITGNLMIRNNPNLTSLSGLDVLESIGGSFDIQNNTSLTHLNELNALKSTGGPFDINNNSQLQNLDGLSALKSTGWSFIIRNNSALTGINGLNALESIGGNLDIELNSQLQNLNGLSALKSIGQNLSIIENAQLQNFGMLSSLKSIGNDIYILHNAVLTHLNGLNTLETIGGGLTIQSNSQLQHLDGLSSLISINGSLIISSNPVLTGITGLRNIDPETIGGSAGLYIVNNPLLSVCNLANFCTYLSINLLTRPRTISDNAGNCLTLEKVNEVCSASCPTGNVTFTSQADIDDFGIMYIHCPSIVVNDLTIGYASESTDITDLTPLWNITGVTGNLTIRNNPGLISLEGLNSLTDIGALLDIESNSQLQNLDGLNSLESIGGGLTVDNNPLLKNLNGLSSLQSVAYLFINNNAQLADITGLANVDPVTVTDITGLHITDNTSLSVCNLPNFCVYLSNPVGTHPRTISGNAGSCMDITEVTAACSLACSTGDKIFTSQAEIDHFGLMYIHCTDIVLNNLTIGYASGSSTTDITDLTPLQHITGVTGNLVIRNSPALTSPDGLSSLKTIGGDLRIFSSMLQNLDGLSSLSGVGGNINIESNSQLQNLDGLNKLAAVGGNFSINSNSQLQNLDGLSKLKSTGGNLGIAYNFQIQNLDGLGSLENTGGHLYISHNSQLQNIDGLSALESIGGFLAFEQNNVLTDLNGLSALTSIGGYLTIAESPLVQNLDGLSSLENIGGYLRIHNSQIENLNGLSSLTDIGGHLSLEDNPQLQNLNGLSSLTGIGGYLRLEDNPQLQNLNGLNSLAGIGGYLHIYGNTVLENLDALSLLAGIDGYLRIQNNPSLTDISGIAQINPATITGATGLYIVDNTSLTVCNLPNLCIYLANPSNPRTLSGNAGFCLDEQTVSDYCVSCPTGNKTFTTQAEIDAFGIASTYCTDIVLNDLIIGYASGSSITDITDLTPLKNITGVTNLTIRNNPVLISTSGLSLSENIDGYIYIYNNSQLQNLDGLSTFTSIEGPLDIYDNPQLQNLNGLSSLKSVGGFVDFRENSALISLTGLDALESIGGYLNIESNSGLQNLEGLSALTTIGGQLDIRHNSALISLNGLESLENIGNYLNIQSNSQLQSPEGLNSLVSIGSYLFIQSNPQLESLEGLAALENIWGDLAISDNALLTDISDLAYIDPATIMGLDIKDNPLLAVCNLPNLCTYLQGSGSRTISGNADDCISEEAVTAACQADCEMTFTLSAGVLNYPAPDSLTAGSILFITTIADGSNTLSYKKDGTAQTPVSVTISSGEFTLTGLGAGEYTDFVITVEETLCEAVYAGPVILYARPGISDVSATGVTTVTADIQAIIDAGDGDASATVIYGTDPTLASGTVSQTLADIVTPAESPAVKQVEISDLTPNTTYYYKITATNPYGSVESAIGSFNTLSDHTVLPDANGIIYVRKGAAGNGSSWDNALGELADALVAARQLNAIEAGTVKQIWVAGGTYYPMYSPADDNFGNAAGRNNAFLLVKDVEVYGGFAGTEDAVEARNSGNVTLLSGDLDKSGTLNSNDAYHVVISAGDVGTARLNGVTITGGYANGSNSLTVNSTAIDRADGAGMYTESSSPVLEHVEITANYTSRYGAGMYNSNGSPVLNNVAITNNTGSGIYNTYSSPRITDAVISGNTALTVGATYFGAGIRNHYSDPVLHRVTISGNKAPHASNNGGGMYNEYSSPVLNEVTISNNEAYAAGAGMYNYSSAPVLQQVTITGNYMTSASSGNGGGLYSDYSSSPKLTDVTITGNTARQGAGVYNRSSPGGVFTNVIIKDNTSTYRGGGILNDNSSVQMTNVAITGNTATTNAGGGMLNGVSSPQMTNVTISGNTAGGNGGGIANLSSSYPKIHNSIIYGNNTDVYNDASTPQYAHSLVAGSGGSGNWDAAGFGTDDGHNIDADPLFADAGYTLKPGSPAINAGSNALFAGLDADTKDLAGNARVHNYSTGGTIDMGAYESPYSLTPAYTYSETITKTYGDAAFEPEITSTSDGAFTYSSSDEGVATISGNTVIIVSAGTATITATQAETADYNEGSISLTLTVGKADITGITLPGESFVYDGTSKSLALTGTLPEGASVEYTNNERTLVGVQIAKAGITGVNYNPLELTAELKITPMTFVFSIKSSTNPLTCSGSGGSVTFESNLPVGMYSLGYIHDGTAKQDNITVTAGGEFTLNDLTAGDYTAFSINDPDRGSGTLSGPVTLSNPATPDLIIGTVVNPTHSSTSSGSIAFTTTLPDGEYTLNYIRVAASQTRAVTISSGAFTLTGLNAAAYSNFFIVDPATGCAAVAAGPVTLGNRPGLSGVSILNITSNSPSSNSASVRRTLNSGSSEASAVIIYGTDPELDSGTITKAIGSVGVNIGTTTTTVIANDFVMGTTYYYKVVATNSFGSVETAIHSFRIPWNDNIMTSLTTNRGGLTPSFSPYSISYTMRVSSTVSSITFTPVLSSSFATVKVNGVTTASGTASEPVPLNEGPNSIPIVVTAENGNTFTYTVLVSRKYAQTITFTLSKDTIVYGDPVPAITATASSGLPVSISSSNSSIATATPTLVTVRKAGTVTFTASQSGNTTTYDAAPNVQRTLVILPAAVAGVSYKDSAHTYDGTEKELLITGSLPEGTSVEYTNNKRILTGEQEAEALITGESYDTLRLTAKLKINPLDIVFSVKESTDPLTCSGAEGSITFSSNLPAGNYPLDYSHNSIVKQTGITAAVGGEFTFSGLTAGDYTAFSIHDPDRGSGTLSGTVTLNDPATPALTLGISSDPTTCNGTDGSIAFTTSDLPDGSYTLRFAKGGEADSVAVNVSDNAFTMGGLSSGTYSNFSVTINGCTGTTSASVTLTDPSIPTLTLGTLTHPGACGGSDGSIAFSTTNLPDGSYTLRFTKNGAADSATVNVSGNAFILSSLTAGSYAGFSVTLSGCTGTSPGSAALSDPSAPVLALGSSGNPTLCSGTDGSILFDTENLPDGSYTLKFTKNGMADSAEVNVSGNAFVLNDLTAGIYTNFSVTDAECTGTASGTITLTEPAVPTLALGSSADPALCEGTDGNITFNTDLTDGSYKLKFTKNGAADSTVVNVSENTFTLSGLTAGSYAGFSINVNECNGTASGSVTLNDPLTPVLTLETSAGPTVCSGTDGNIAFTTDLADGNYTLRFTKNGAADSAAVNVSANAFTLSGLTAGTYTGFSISVNGCNGIASGSVTLNDPLTPVLTLETSANPVTCSGTDGNITFTTNLPDGSYTLRFAKNGEADSVVVNVSGNAFTLTGLTAGNYSGFSMTVSGCTGTASGSVTLSGPFTPALTLGAQTHPESCGGNDGSITFNTANLPDGSYTLKFIKGGAADSSVVNVSGNVFTLGNLTAGSYTNFSITTASGCTGTASGLAALSDPTASELNLGTATNPTVCSGADGSIVFSTVNLPDGPYKLRFTRSGAADSVLINVSGNAFTLSGLVADTYTNFSITNDGCTGTATGTVTLTDPATPALTLGTQTNPTICNGADGSIAFNTDLPDKSYILRFTKSGAADSAIVNVSGSQFTLGNLTAGSYAAFSVVVNGCTGTATSTITLTDPATPVLTLGVQTNPTTCNGANGSIVFNTDLPDNSYTLRFIKGGTADSAVVNVSGNQFTLGNLTAGSYTGFSVTVNGCTGTAAGTITLTDPATPVLTLGAQTNPTTCNGANGSIVFSTVNLPDGSYTLRFTRGGAADSSLINVSGNAFTLSGLAAGNYTEFSVTINGCTATASGSVRLNDPATPTLTLGAPANPGTCGSSDGSIAFSTENLANGSYTLRFTKGGNADSAVVNVSGNAFILDDLTAGIYTGFSVTVNECTGTTSGSVALSDPLAPVLNLGTSTNPTVCNGMDGSIAFSITNLPDSSYILKFTHNGRADSAVVNVSGGVFTLSGRIAGTYTNFSVTEGECTGTAVGSVTLIDPAVPTLTLGAPSNPTTCSGTNGSISFASGNLPDGSYTLKFIKDGIADSATVNISGNTFTLSGLAAAIYTDFSVTVSGCTGIASGTVTLSEPPVPGLALGTQTNPAVCNGADGSIAFNTTHLPDGSYTLKFTKDGAADSALVNVSTNAFTMNGLTTGTYTGFSVTLNGCTGTISGTVNLSDPLVPSLTLATHTGPTVCSGDDGHITLNTINLADGSYTLKFTKDGKADSAQVTGSGNTFILSGLSAGTYTGFSVTVSGCMGSTTGSLTLSDPETPTLVFENSADPTECGGSDGTITFGTNLPDGSYILSYFKGSTPLVAEIEAGSGKFTLTGLTTGTYFDFSVTVNECIGASAASVALSDPSAPKLTLGTSADPTACGGSNGSIAFTVTGLADGSYTLRFFNDGKPDSAVVNVKDTAFVLAGLAAGTYTDFSLTVSGCTGTASGSVNLSDPAAPVLSLGEQANPTTCNGVNGTIAFITNLPDGSYTLRFTKGGAVDSAVVNVSENAFTLSALAAGTYTNFSVSTSGCTGTALGSVSLIHPEPPTLTLGTPTQPGTCGSTDGSITFATNLTDGAYTLTYIKGATPLTAEVEVISGEFTLSDLTTGTYSGFSVTANGCTGSAAGTATLSDPLAPTLTLGDSVNPTVCNGTDGSIAFSTSLTNGTYTLNYAKDTTPMTAEVIVAAGKFILNGLAAGTYSGFSITVSGCTGSAAGTPSLSDPSAPTLSLENSMNPTICNGTADGSITFSTSLANGTYTLNYAKDTTPMTAEVIVAAGKFNLSGLSAGVYSGFSITVNGCTGSATGTATLSDPSAPILSLESSMNPTTCEGTNGSIAFSTNLNDGVYSLTYLKGATSLTTDITVASGKFTLNELSAGIYSIFSITISACTGREIGPVTLSDPVTPTLTLGDSVNPAVCNGTDGSITFPTNLANGTYILNYSKGTTPLTAEVTVNSEKFTLSGLSAGAYSGFSVTVNGCTGSAAGTATLSDPIAPTLTLGDSVNPAVCNGTDGSITFSTNLANGTYILNYSKGTTPLTAEVTVNSGKFTLSGLSAGTYSGFSVTANGCTGSAVGTASLSDPVAPTLTLGDSVNPTACNGTNGSIAFSTNLANGTYTLNYSQGTIPLTAEVTVATGKFTLNGLTAGAYSGFSVTANGCTGSAAGTATLSAPIAPTLTLGDSVNPTVCNGTDGNIAFSTNLANGTYTLNYSKGAAPLAAEVTVTAGKFTLGGLAAGTYSNFSITISGCTGRVSGPATLSDPVTPTLTLGNSENPTTCEGTNGSIAFSTNLTNGTYILNYSKGTTPLTAEITVVAGKFTLNGLSAGTYSGFSVTANGCTGSAAGTATLSNPASPTLVAATVANPVTCFGKGSITFTTSHFPDGAYTLSFKKETKDTTAQITVNGNTFALTGLTAGAYSGFSITRNGCTATLPGTVTLTDPVAPVLTTGTITQPAVCGGTGSIRFNTTGLAAGTHTLTFKKDGKDTTAQVSVSNNTFTLTGLPAGAYSAFGISATGCQYTLISTITLTNPAAPAAAITPNGPTELCEDDKVTLTATQAASYLWSTGNTTRSITVDVAGLYSVKITTAQGCTSQAQITVIQKICNVPPMAVCKPHVVLVVKDNCYATLRPEDLDAGSYDENNDWFNRSIDINPDLTVGSYTATFTVVDIRGASTSCQSRVDVVDHTPPVALARSLTLPLDQNGNASISVSDVDAGSKDNCGPVTLTLSRTHFSCSDLGSHRVTLTATDASGNTSSAIADITVVDNIPPTVITKAVTLQLNHSGQATLTAADLTEVISDNCGIWDVRLSQTQFSCEHIGVNRVVLTVEDVHGGTFSDTVSVTVVDNIPPVIVVSPATLYLDNSGQAHLDNALIGLSVTDNCAVDSVQLSRTSFDCEDLGEHRIRITAIDLNGNTSDTTVTVMVVDTLTPVVKTRDVTLFLDASGLTTLTPGLVDDGSSDNCDIMSPELSRTAFDCADTGHHTITYTLTDAAGNRSSATLLVTIHDTIRPVARTQNVILELSDAGTASLTPEEVDNLSSDNCAIASMTLSQTLFTCTDLGSRLITLTVTDVNGNSATEKAEVLIRDPQGICPCSYGMLATDGIVLRSNEVSAGGIGITSPSGKVKLRNTVVNQEGTFVKAPHTRFDSESESSTYFRGSAPQPETFRKNSGKDKGKEKIGKGESKILAAGRYGKIKVAKDATLTFSGGEVYIHSLKVKKKAKIRFADPTVLLVRDRVRLASQVEFNSGNESGRLYAGRRITIGNGAEIHGYLHTQSTLKTRGGSVDTRMEGFFAANRIKGGRNTQWSGGGVLCRENEQQQQSTSTKARRNMIAEEESQQAPEAEPEIRVSLSPNPASDKTQAGVFLPSGKGELTMIDILGNVLIRKAISTAQSLHHLDIRAFRPGVYIIRVTDGEQVKTVRLVKENF